MSDKYTSLFTIDASFVEGEQPTAQKLTNIVSLTKSSLVQLEKAVGMIRDSLIVERTGNATWVPIPAKDGHDTVRVESLKLDFPSHIVSVARAIGPMSGLNPRYLSGQTWYKDDLGGAAVGVLLRSGVTDQQLPFRPLDVNNINPSDFSGPNAASIFQTRVTSYEPSLEVGKYYVTPEGRLFTGAPVRTGTRLKYSFTIGEGDGYIGSGYNVIPDPSILTFTLEERDNKTSDTEDFGACRVLVSSITEEALVVDILLPEVISTPFSKLTRSHAVEDSDPVGKLDEGLPDIRRYSLPDYYADSGILEENTLYLYYTQIGKVIPEARFERLSEFQIRAYLPPRYKTIVRSDDEELFNVVGISNTKHFFLITNGTQLAPLVGKLRLEMEEHSHNGLDSIRISHNDLSDVNHILPWRSSQLNIYGNVAGVIPEKNIDLIGLFLNKTKWFNRKLSKGEFFEENPHPYYLHRLGYLGGGTDGLYASINGRQLGGSLGNGFTGDLVLMPVTASDKTSEAGYTWESTDELDYENNNSASHSLWFGLPWEIDTLDLSEGIAQRQRNGSVRMYFDPYIRVMGYSSGLYSLPEPFSAEGLGILNTGTIGADVFSNEVFENAIKGLNIQRGNFFFGYNEDKFLSTTERAKGKSSFNIIASEFNAVVTANKKATQSGEVRWKGQSGNRSGFAVKAIEGSSINFSIGGLTGAAGNNSVNTASLSNYATPGQNLAGSFTVEAAFGNQLISLVKGHGSGILMSPGTGSRKLFPWQLKSPELGIDDLLLPTKYAGWNNLEQINDNFVIINSQNLGGLGHIFSILDDVSIQSYLTFAKSVDLTESVKNKNSFPFGKLILEGSSGIDLLVSRGTYSSASAGISNVLDLSEVRLWAREDLREDIENGIRDNHAPGANLNLMYGYGKAYSRFAVNLPWYGTEEDLKGAKVPNPTSIDGSVTSWAGIRSECRDGITNKDTTGSQIRQASFIEAMEGFRSDPSQPFTVTYRLPFRAIQRLDWQSDGYTTEYGIEINKPLGSNLLTGTIGGIDKSLMFLPGAIIASIPVAKKSITAGILQTDDQFPNPPIKVSTHVSQPGIEDGRFVFNRADSLIDDSGYGVFVDQIIRYYDFQDWANKEYQGKFSPGSSLVDFKVDLNYSKLVYGDSADEHYGQQINRENPANISRFESAFSETEGIMSYISTKHSSVIRGCLDGASRLEDRAKDGGMVIRSFGSTSIPDTDEESWKNYWHVAGTQEPYKASLMLGLTSLNDSDTNYKGHDSIGLTALNTYFENIKDQIDPSTGNSPKYNGEDSPDETEDVPGLVWYIQLEGEPKIDAYQLYRFAPYELFMTSNGKLHGKGPGEKLMMAFDGYVTLTFRTMGGGPIARSGVITP
jgi:hypothetical protein